MHDQSSRPTQQTADKTTLATTWSLSDRIGMVGGIIGFFGAVFTALGWVVALQSKQVATDANQIARDANTTAQAAHVLAQKGFDRAAGKGGAGITIVEVRPDVSELPPAARFKSIFDEEALRVLSLSQLVGVNPRLVIRNTGEEVIEEVRVEVRFVWGTIDARGLPKKQQSAVNPYVLKVSRDSAELGSKFLPGQSLQISILKGLIHQLVQAQAEDRGDVDQYGIFEISCLGRPVGVSAFDKQIGRDATFKFAWRAGGFPRSECHKLIQALKLAPVPLN